MNCHTVNHCWLCGRTGADDPLDVHHIFGGAYRAKSERYGLTVLLCHRRCHIFGANAAHANADTMRKLHEFGQRYAMERYGWDLDDWRREFGKNYLSDEALAEIGKENTEDTSALVLTGEVLPF